ncbi:MAG: hypothetical protein ACRDJ5_09700 [Actinomycetota bacterium]
MAEAFFFDPRAIIRSLNEHEVRYVLIGALAATLHGSPLRTGDADICPERGGANLHRLAQALRTMDARVFTPGEVQGIEFACDAKMLASAEVWNLTTRFGRLDISFTPSGTRGYPDLMRDVVRFEIDEGLVAPTASLADIVRTKEAAGRLKDQAVLPVLRELLDRSGP